MTEKRHGLTIIILTRNEKDNIEACISSAKFADDIIVVDSGSEDNTMEIAEKCGARVFLNPFESFAGQRNFGLEHVTTDWVMYLDADERIMDEMRQDIQNIVEANERYAYKVKRCQIIFGQQIKYGGHAPDYTLRLFPSDAIKWEGIVHEGVITNLQTKNVAGYMEHYTYNDWDKYFVKFNQYTTLMAEKMHEKGKRGSFADILFHPIFAFIKVYILKLGFLEGKIGFIMSALHYAYTLSKYVKLYYMK